MDAVELINIKEVIKKRLELGPIEETNYLSSILKRKRIELKLTLSEVTKNICSEAFLSKVERNLMSSKNERVALLCERLDLDYNTLSKLEDNRRIEKALYLYIDSEYDQILEMDEKICEGVFVAEDEIIKSFKYLIKREFKKLNSCILGLDTVKECLSDVELFSLLLIVYEYNVYILRCNKALNYMDLLESFCLKNERCRLYLKEKRFILSCIMEHSDVKYLFEDLRRDFHLYPMHKQFAFFLFYQQSLYTEDAYNYLEAMGKNYIPEIYKEDYYYAKALILSKLNKHLEAMKEILESGYSRAKFVCLFAYNLYMYSSCLPSESEFKSYKGKLYSLMKIGTRNSGDTYHIAFLKLMQLEIDNAPLENVCNHIKNCLIKELYEYCFPLYDDYIKDRYCLLLGKLCRYKDAYMFLLQTKIHLKK